jgi:signal transduction histidine kinase
MASRAKSDFLARMSHELRTPLNSIIGFSEVMLMGLAGELSEEQHRQTEMINSSGKHLLQLINDILDLSKVEAGSTEVVPAPFDAGALVRSVGETVAVQARERGLELLVDVPPEPLGVVSDERLVRQILLNLLGNALKFTEEGSVTIRVAREGASVRFEVVDTGPGIDAEHQVHIFDEFWQLTPQDGSKPKGTGLGLAISSQMAQLLGGTLACTSAPGQGATFTLTLPLVRRA